MATVTFYQAGNMQNSIFWFGTVTGYSSSHLSVLASPLFGTYYGTGFTYLTDGGLLRVTGGTITDYAQTKSSSWDYTVTGLSVDAVTMGNYQAQGNASGLLQYALRSNDTIIGSESADVMYGWDGDDIIGGLGGNDLIYGGAGNDSLVGGLENDFLDGGAGTDTALYSGERVANTITKTTSGYTVSGPDGLDTLSNIERLHFSDESVAIDISGNAGTTAKILGAVFGASSVSSESYSKEYVGIGLSFLDGGMSYQNLMQLALNARLGAGFSNTAEVNLLYQNLVGVLPSAADLNYWTGTLGSGQFSPASLAVMAADLELNTTNINLAGLVQTGIEYS